ncbi:MAG: methylthioribulose 1-phosphate dehydratase [Sulfuricaulis sp.]
MARSLDDLPARAALVEIARDFHARGWMAGTAGNLSAREDDQHFWITASGQPKGRLDDLDFLLVRVADGEIIECLRPQNKPSAETVIHQAIYTLFPEARACLHGHSVETCLAADRTKSGSKALRLVPIEMIKGFDIWEQHPKVDLPLFENIHDVAHIAKDIRRRFGKTLPRLSALMIRDHGPTVWGTSLQQAYNRFEILEYILRYQARARR